jgi:two-component system, OmpR family, sensor histidine kinase ChvG
MDDDRDGFGRESVWRRIFGRLSLTRRILLVNILPLALLAGSFFYLDGFRSQLIDERRTLAEKETLLIAEAFNREDRDEWPQLASDLGRTSGVRIRLTRSDGKIVADSWAGGPPGFTPKDPSTEGWQRQIARKLDEGIDWVVDATVPPDYVEATDHIRPRPKDSLVSLARDRTHMIEAQAGLTGGYHVVTLRNARDIRRLVRAERARLGYTLAGSSLIAILLSLFLARTIVRPLQVLARAVTLVRFGQAREVNIPRLPFRGDEIGSLARSVSDMSHTLRERMDATEGFAADVAHEIKNPLASLSSAIETLRTVKKPELRAQLQDIIADDVRRLDRLITEISQLSRIDSQIARSHFEPVDVQMMVESIVDGRKARSVLDKVDIVAARSAIGLCRALGDPGQLARVIENLLDNAVSFSPEKGIVRIAATLDGKQVVVTVDDEGPGIADGARDIIFERFHSDRPAGSFGRHSGLGLSIARAIIEAHGGTIEAVARGAKQKGARFAFRLPAFGG